MIPDKSKPVEDDEWQPVIRLGAPTPQQMRRKDPKTGEWVYRDPTEEDIQEFLSSEAW